MSNEGMTTSKRGLDMIAKWEGNVLKRYVCPAGKVTIGIGHVIVPGDNIGETITKEESFEILARDVARFEAAIRKHITVELEQHQFDAIVGFIFNTGEGGIINTGLQRALNESRFEDVPGELLKWCKFKVNGVMQVNKGLENRRKHEGQVFATPYDPTFTEWTDELLREAQQKLADLGLYTIAVDGEWGPSTERAVKAFAERSGVSAGGHPSAGVPEAYLEALRSA